MTLAVLPVAVLDEYTPVFYVRQAGFFRETLGLSAGNADLRPDYGLFPRLFDPIQYVAHHLSRLGRPSEYVYDVDGDIFGYRLHVRVTSLTVHFLTIRVDRNDRIADFNQVATDRIAGSIRPGRTPDYGDRAGTLEDFFDGAHDIGE